MTKDELVDALSQKLQIPKKNVKSLLEGFMDIITETLKRGEEVNLVGFGAFYGAKRKSRQGVNPRTGEKITIPEMLVPKFRPGKKLKDALRQ